MLTLESLNLDKPLYAFLAIGFAGKALPIWEAKYPEDMSPRRAIEAAKEWLKNPSADAAANAAYAADAAVNAAYAADAAANAAYAAHAAAAPAYATAANAAASAARALETDVEALIHEVILENLDWILQYKIESGQSFAQPELIFDYLTEEQKQSFLFNLDAVA